MKKWIKQYREKRFKQYKLGHIRQVTVETSFENLQIDWQTEGQTYACQGFLPETKNKGIRSFLIKVVIELRWDWVELGFSWVKVELRWD